MSILSALRCEPAARAVAWLFFANGFLFANWAVRIPAVKARLALGEAELGLALLCMALGGIIAMPLGGALVARLGSRKIALVATLLYCFAFIAPAAAPSLPLLMLGLLAAGIGNGAMDVAMNAQADAVEKHRRIRIMTVCHALFSLGLAAGALPAGVIASAGIAPVTHLALIGGLLALPLLRLRHDLVAEATAAAGSPVFAIPRGPLLGLGLLAFCSAVAEGSMNDWAAVFYRETLQTTPLMAGLALSVFSGAMLIGRLFGESAIERLGATAVVRLGMLIAAAGLAGALIIAQPVSGLIGLALLGLGVACVFPIVFRASASAPGSPGPNMAAAVTLGYGGFLAGPALIGLAGELVGLRAALGIVVILCIAGAGLAASVARIEGQAAAPPLAGQARAR